MFPMNTKKVKVKLSLCLTKHHAMKMYRDYTSEITVIKVKLGIYIHHKNFPTPLKNSKILSMKPLV
jgi:hypothetical protein